MQILHSVIKPIKRQGKISPGVFWYRFWIAALVILIPLITIISGFVPVNAQEEETLLVQSPDTGEFPIVSVDFKHLFDPNLSAHHLEMNQVRVIENERNVSVLSLDQGYKGVYFVLAINGGRELALRDQNGISVFDHLRNALVDWGKSLSFSEGDTWSLTTNEGVLARNSTNPGVWADALASYQPDFRNMTPDLTSLESAIQLEKERVVPFGVDKSLLYLTTPPSPDQIPTINALANDARSAGIIVNVWMVGERFYLSNDQGGALMNLADTTRGQFFHYSDAGPVPSPDIYLSGLGSIYTLAYESDIRETGTYPLQIEIALPEGETRGESGPFYVEVHPPNPILVSPPTTITRTPSEDGLSPINQTINIMVEFPDHHPREIVASRLWVDGQLADEHKVGPFDTFIWDLSSINESGIHWIEAEVTDAFGFSARTIKTPVEITFITPDPTPNFPPQQLGIIFIISILTAVSILGAAWLVKRSWPKRLAEPNGTILAFSGMAPASLDLPESESVEKAIGALIPLNGADKVMGKGVIQISQQQAIIGSDPYRVDLVVEGAGVGRLQAEVRYQQGVFWIRDLGSPLGTWVNNVQIDSRPSAIKHGDLIHFGEAGFRFTINEYEAPTTVTIEPYQPIL